MQMGHWLLLLGMLGLVISPACGQVPGMEHVFAVAPLSITAKGAGALLCV